MKKALPAIAAFAALIASPALAADMVFKAPPPPVPVAWTWSGFYFGINGGYGWNASTTSFSCVSPFGAGLGCPLYSTATSPQGGLFGGQAGYNFQRGKFVYGVETDFQWSGIRSSPTLGFPATVPVVGGGVLGTPSTVNVTQNLDWFGTVRLRLGFTPVARTLVYATGGLFYGRENVSFSDNFPGAPGFYAAAAASTRVGGTVGGGIEYAFSPALSAKLEGLYYNMGSQTVSFLNPLTTFTAAEAYNYTGGIVRAGLNWKFGRPLFAPLYAMP